MLDTMGDSSAEPPLSHWKVPRVQGDLPNCTMHSFNTLPMLDRNVLVSSAYAAGTTVVDFTDPTAPREVGHHDPHGANTWSAYWYNGQIYTNDGGRGVDVMLLADPARAGCRTPTRRRRTPSSSDLGSCKGGSPRPREADGGSDRPWCAVPQPRM